MINRPVLIKLAILLASSGNILHAQSSLVLSSGSTVPGGSAALNLSLASPVGSEPASMQWTFSYPSASITSFTVVAGPALTAVTKSITCNGNSSAYMCIAYGMNSTAIQNGVVATVTVTLAAGAGSTVIGMANALSASAAGTSLAVVAAGGTINVASPITLSRIACTPTTLASGQASLCTVALSAAATSTVVVTLSSSTVALTVPESVTLPAGAINATFNATAGAVVPSQSAVITATVGTVSVTQGIALAVPAVLSTMACLPTMIIPGSSGSCTVTLAGPISGASVISLTATNAGQHVPASLTIAGGSTSGTFAFTTDSKLSGWLIVSATLGTVTKAVSFTITTVTTPPAVSVTVPQAGATVSGTVAVTANASGTVAVTSVQFELDGANLGSPVTGAGPSYGVSLNTVNLVNGPHTLAAMACNAAGITGASSSVSVTVNNPVPPVISGVGAGAITQSSATITWSTDTASDSQVAYGITSVYGSTASVAGLVTTHTVTLTGLAASTVYHYQAISSAQGKAAGSGDLTFTTSAPPGPQTLLLLHSDTSELSGATNGSIVTPAIAPPGFSGTVVVTGGGSVNFAPAQTGNGVYFLQCCGNSANAYYKFPGTAVGSIFNLNQGQISFYLKSRQSFAQRLASATSYRQVCDVQDASTDLFGFNTQAIYGYLRFSYTLAGASAYYIPPAGTEEALFGKGITLKVTMTWDGSLAKLYLNDTVINQFSYTAPTSNWSAASNFDLGAYEYATFGGYNSCDDIIDEFTVTGPAIPVAPVRSSALMTPRSEIETANRPVITRLQNGADEGAPAACSPEAVATLVGRFLPEGATPASDRSGRATSLAGARVLINGSYSPVLYVSSERVDFLCPAVPPSTSLEIAIETAAGLSNRVETRVEEASPGIFATDGPTGQPGGTVSIRATGMNWLKKFPTVRPFVRIGTQYVPIESITADPQDPGVSTLTVTLPSDVLGDSVPVIIEVVQTDGRSVASNPASIPVETRLRAASHPLVVQ